MTDSLTGEELMVVHKSVDYQNLVINRLGNSPTESIKKISDAFGYVPSVSGGNCRSIEITRRISEQICSKGENNFLTIVAPHTHWPSEYPIIFNELDDERYLVGTRKPIADKMYYPVSFLYSCFGPLPYEWSPENRTMSKETHADMVSAVSRMNRVIFGFQWPLGIAIDFRFRRLFIDPPVSSIELPADDSEFGFPSSTIERDSVEIEDQENLDIGQVGWPMHVSTGDSDVDELIRTLVVQK